MIPAVFSEEDCKIVLRCCSEFDGLWERINSFMWLEPDLRPMQAARYLRTLLRQEWMRYGLSPEEVDNLFAFKRKMVRFDRLHRPENLDPMAAKLRIQVYDMPKAIFGNSETDAPHEGKDLERLQEIAGDIIFAAPHHARYRRVLRGLIQSDTAEDRWVKDVEKLLLLERLADKPATCRETFDECWSDLRGNWLSHGAMMLAYDIADNARKAALSA